MVVYNCFFTESRQAKQHRRDVTVRAVGKRKTWVIAGGLLGEGEWFR